MLHAPEQYIWSNNRSDYSIWDEYLINLKELQVDVVRVIETYARYGLKSDIDHYNIDILAFSEHETAVD